MSLLEVGKHLVIDPGVCFGKLTFRGTRVPVEAVLARLARDDAKRIFETDSAAGEGLKGTIQEASQPKP